MAHVDVMLKQAIEAYKANDKATARDLLMKVVDLDERNEEGWLWLAGVMDSVEQRQVCLENVLAINPNNERAKKGLAKITGSAPPPPAPQPPAADPFASAADPFAATTDPFGSNSLFGDMNFGAPEDAPATSVDWGSSSGAAAYGSGRNVQQPTSDQYDDWISNMGIGQDSGGDPFGETSAPAAGSFGAGSAAGSDPFSGGAASNPFGDSSDLYGSSAPAADPFGGASASNPFESAANDPFSSQSNPWDNTADQTSDPFGSSDSSWSNSPPSIGYSAPAYEPQSDPFIEEEPMAADPVLDDIGIVTDFSFDDDDEDDFSFLNSAAPQPSSGSGAQFFAQVADDFDDNEVFAEIEADRAQQYYALIPEELRASSPLATIGVVVLAILNVIALVLLVA